MVSFHLPSASPESTAQAKFQTPDSETPKVGPLSERVTVRVQLRAPTSGQCSKPKQNSFCCWSGDLKALLIYIDVLPNMNVDDWYANQLVELLEIGNGLPLLRQQQLDNIDCKKIPDTQTTNWMSQSSQIQLAVSPDSFFLKADTSIVPLIVL